MTAQHIPHDRDASDPKMLTLGVSSWLLAHRVKKEQAEHDLTQVLLEVGFMSPLDTIHCIEENETQDGIVITLDNMDAFNIDLVSGTVTQLPE